VDDIWKELRKVIDIETKAFAEKQAINTAKQLNEIHEATRKEMNDRTWIYTRDMGALYREATAKIEALEAQLKGAVERNNELEAETKNRKEIIKKYEDAYGALIVKNSRLQAELDNLALAAHSDKRFSGYETIHINPEEVIKTQDLQREAVDLLKAEAERAQAHSRAEAERHEEHRRDMFACAAMEGILASMQSIGLEDFVAKRAYEQADAMLKARGKK